MKVIFLEERSSMPPNMETFRDGERAIKNRALPLSPSGAEAKEKKQIYRAGDITL